MKLHNPQNEMQRFLSPKMSSSNKQEFINVRTNKERFIISKQLHFEWQLFFWKAESFNSPEVTTKDTAIPNGLADCADSSLREEWGREKVLQL